MDWRNSGCTGFSLMEVIKIKVLPNERSDREVQKIFEGDQRKFECNRQLAKLLC